MQAPPKSAAGQRIKRHETARAALSRAFGQRSSRHQGAQRPQVLRHRVWMDILQFRGRGQVDRRRLATAAAAFLRYFGAVPGRGAVITMGGQAILPAQELEKAGAQWLMPWLSLKGIEAALEKQMLAQLKAQGVPDAFMPQVLEQAKKQIQSQFGGHLAANVPCSTS